MTAASTNSGPGRQLQQARLAAKLSLEDVARSLQLSPTRLRALEADDYDRLPAPTYVRGYLRGYAQLLGLPPQPLIEDFNRSAAASRRQEFIPPAPPAQAHATNNESLIKLGALAVAGIVIGLAVVWWQGSEAPVTPTVPAALPPAAPAAQDLTKEQAASDDAPQTPAPTAADVSPSTASPAQMPTPAVSPPATERPTTVTRDRPTPLPVDPNVPRARLVLYVSDDSWAEVRDNSNQRLIYETVAAGRVVTLDGVAPFHVFLGNAEGVRVEINGRPYDVRPHKRGQVARFTLGTNVAATP